MAFTLRLPPELAERLSEIAQQRGMSRSDLIIAILRQWVKRHT
jgi:predicted transcriptional regulator